MFKISKVHLLPLSHLLLYLGCALLLAHLCLSDLVNPAIGYPIGFGLVLLLLLRLLITHHYIDYTLIIFACSYFYYGNNHGGLWNYINIAALLIYALIDPWRYRPAHLSPLVKVLLWTLFFTNTLGLVFVAQSSTIGRIEGFTISLSYGLMYLFILRLPAILPFFKRLLLIVSILCAWNVAITLNQKLMLVNIPSPLFPAGSGQGSENSGWESYNTKSERVTGSFHDFELLAEYSSLIFALFLPLVLTQTHRYLQLKFYIPPITLLGCLLTIIATATRSSILLIIPISGFCLLFYYKQLIRRPTFLLAIGAFMGAILVVGPYIGLDFVLERLGELNISKLTSNPAVSAEAMNRDVVYDMGLKRLKEDDWLLGYGYGTSDHYEMAMYGSVTAEEGRVPDYHNLYLSLPILMGWIGALAFISLIFYHLTLLMIQCSRVKHVTIQALLLGLIVFWCVFLVNEFKIQAVREPNYFMLIWCWLGFSALLSRLSSQRLRLCAISKPITELI